MDLDAAFNTLQEEVNADEDLVDEARSRRNVFRDAFLQEEDVLEVLFIGSIARGSQIEPIKDVDLVAIYDRAAHDGWGDAGPSAQEALDHTQARVNALLGEEGTHQAGFVRLTRTGNHAVKCFLDDPDDPDAFTVDVVPGLRNEDEALSITEAETDSWIPTNPELMNTRVADRHADWNRFVPLVRDLKRWSSDKNSGMIPLLLEVLALTDLPQDRRSAALASFFASAVRTIDQPVLDPAEISEIQPDLDKAVAREHLQQAADSAWRAVAAEDREDTDTAACFWREVFGDIFPEPPGGCGDSRASLAATVAGAQVTEHRRPVRDAPQG